jgi:hypothetical protein
LIVCSQRRKAHHSRMTACKLEGMSKPPQV